MEKTHSPRLQDFLTAKFAYKDFEEEETHTLQLQPSIISYSTNNECAYNFSGDLLQQPLWLKSFNALGASRKS